MRHFTTSSPFSVIWDLFAFYARGTPRPDSILFCSIRACAKLLSQYLKSDHMTQAFISRLWRWGDLPAPGFCIILALWHGEPADKATSIRSRASFSFLVWAQSKPTNSNISLEYIAYRNTSKTPRDSKIIKQLSDVPKTQCIKKVKLWAKLPACSVNVRG